MLLRVRFKLSFNNNGDTSYFVVTARYNATQSTGESFMSSRRRTKISAVGHELHPLVKLWISPYVRLVVVFN